MNRKMTISVLLTLLCCCTILYGSRAQSNFNEIINSAQNSDGIRLVSIKTPVRQGDLCSIVIDGKPGVPYSAKCTYLLGTFPETINQTKVSKSNGRVTWTWFVKEITSPGTYQITVSGGGDSINASYTVIR